MTTQALSIEAIIADLLQPELKGLGYGLVQVKLLAGGSHPTLQVMAERLDSKPMTVQDCVTISRTVNVKFEAEEIATSEWTLEVSSPGIDRPLVRMEDFERFAGRMALVDLQTPVAGRKRFEGQIVRITGREPDAELELSTAQGAVRMPLKGIAQARLSAKEVSSHDDKTEQ